MSLARTISLIRQGGLSRYWRNLQSLGDAKAGTFVGADQLGNRYYEDLNEVPGRHRWVEYAENSEFNASQVAPAWHAWLHHTHELPPTKNPRMQERNTWESVSSLCSITIDGGVDGEDRDRIAGGDSSSSR